MSSLNLIGYLTESIEATREDYVNDLQACTPEMLSFRPEKGGRSIADFTYEVAVVNNRIAARMRGEDPGPWPFEGWVTAPEDMQSTEALVNAINESANAVTEALKGQTEEKLLEEVTFGNSSPTSLFKLAAMVPYHTGYHDGQMNYIQSLHGDQDVHWK